MGIISLIKLALEGVVLFLKLKNRSFYNDMFIGWQKRRRELTQEIERLRATGDQQDSITADLLMDRFLQEKTEFQEIKRLYSKSDTEQMVKAIKDEEMLEKYEPLP